MDIKERMNTPIRYETKIEVRYQETDQMGVAHHSVYPIWFEAGRTDFIRGYGMPYSWMESEGLMLPLLEMTCKFHSYSKYEDELTVCTIISGVTRTRLSFVYDVEKDGKAIATGTTQHVFVDRRMKPINLLKFKPDIYWMFMRLSGANTD